MKEFKIRCSAIGKLMAGAIGLTDAQQKDYDEKMDRKEGRSKLSLTTKMEEDLKKLQYKKDNPQLPEGAISYIQEWFLQQKYSRKKEWFSKFVDKGLMVEDEAIKMLSMHLHGELKLEKCIEKKSDDFKDGTCDVETEEIIYDTKCSWDLFSFPHFEVEVPKTDYWWQGQGYMSLYNKEKYALVYCLIDTPKPLIDLELKKLYYKSGGVAEDWTPETFIDLAENYKFNDIPFEEKIKIFSFDRDENAIEQIHQRVLLARKYIKENLLTNK